MSRKPSPRRTPQKRKTPRRPNNRPQSEITRAITIVGIVALTGTSLLLAWSKPEVPALMDLAKAALASVLSGLLMTLGAKQSR